MGVVELAENIATQPSLGGAWAELGNIISLTAFGKHIDFYLVRDIRKNENSEYLDTDKIMRFLTGQKLLKI